MDWGSEIIVIPAIFLGLPWIIFHYITKWKTSATLTSSDENLLEELHAMARRLDDRMDTVERIISSDNPDWRPARLTSSDDQDDYGLEQVERLMKERARK
ncbi:envelope stress response membrane protein PspB [Blastomonas sp.]|uniref:envelope stress response membrane protein PspB n=1 Tax=Blastomonas sp. TaxID=1909299 RepID=UPI0026143A0A|nr:envelope stress response membrane protein PspB [Blastomonas sp.]MDM7955449.1 envelope stress response membrane protein PspB [Blastomonas sp.]